ncbi:unnamed protein product [Ambrosiozyma monospora]|uniref:Unnamed protein product n=1 Tax=Ambrosiozyma monospora TaxID=43982 RepID=A0A9W6WLZ3_AMBMO|nr:unnamed protein product [Ambrosiozyma monospora]
MTDLDAKAKELETNKKLSKDQVTKLKDGSTSLENRIKELEKQLQDTKLDSDTKIRTLTEELMKTTSEKDNLKNENTIAELKGKVKTLEASLSSVVPKEELDDMMLVMSDLDDKNKELKKRLRELGAEVSDDDDEDEDDDDYDYDDDDDDGDDEEDDDVD